MPLAEGSCWGRRTRKKLSWPWAAMPASAVAGRAGARGRRRGRLRRWALVHFPRGRLGHGQPGEAEDTGRDRRQADDLPEDGRGRRRNVLAEEDLPDDDGRDRFEDGNDRQALAEVAGLVGALVEQ